MQQYQKRAIKLRYNIGPKMAYQNHTFSSVFIKNTSIIGDKKNTRLFRRQYDNISTSPRLKSSVPIVHTIKCNKVILWILGIYVDMFRTGTFVQAPFICRVGENPSKDTASMTSNINTLYGI